MARRTTRKTDPKTNIKVKGNSKTVSVKRKPYSTSTSKRTAKAEESRGTRGRNQSNRSDAFKSDVKKSGGLSNYLNAAKSAAKRVKKNPTRR